MEKISEAAGRVLADAAGRVRPDAEHAVISSVTQRPYVAFWGGRKFNLFASSSYEAQGLAVLYFQKTSRKKVKSWDVSVVLADVLHAPQDVAP